MVKRSHKKPVAAFSSLDLFPPVNPYSTGFLDVDDMHSLYWEQSGNPDGLPIVFVHGGPGAGATPTHRRFFDPDYYRIIIFDQRGAGRSHPAGCLENNTLDHLIDDMEALRKHMSIERWHLFGGSWGSTLILAYAQRFPERAMSMILRGIFLLEQPEIDWFLYGMGRIFPEARELFVSLIPEEEQGNLLEAYYKRLTGTDEDIRLEAAINWSTYESACSCLLPNIETIITDEQKQNALALALLEAHYFRNEMITPENSLMNSIEKLRAIPAIIIQGRYDVICPIHTAHRLHQEWPEADYIVVPDGGHSALDPAVRFRLVEATETMKTLN